MRVSDGWIGKPAEKLVAQTVLAYDVAVNSRTWSSRSLSVSYVEVVESEPQSPSFGPLEVVDEAPVEVSAQVGSSLDALVNTLKTLHDYPGTYAIGPVGYSIFGDVHRNVQLGVLRYCSYDGIGISLSV